MSIILPYHDNPAVRQSRSAIAQSALVRSNVLIPPTEIEVLPEASTGQPNWRKIDNTPNNPNWRTP